MSSRALIGFVLAISLAAVGAALVSQHMYDMQPCPWCVLQRAIFVVIAIVGLVGLAAPRLGAVLVLLLALSGIATALWQHFVAAASASCNLTLADRIISGLQLDRLAPDVFQPTASCADAAVSMLGVPYEFWSLALFVVVVVLSVLALRRPQAR
jgi:disulfide bond formation protein DsbB